MLLPRPLGRTGLKVSPLGLGTVKLGRNRGVKYPSAFEIPDDVQAADLLRKAQKLGITLLDTAPAYGEAEERLGRIIGSCGGRDRWTIITKAGEEFDPATGEPRFDFSPAAIIASVERSLRRLKTNHLDAVLLHSDGRDEWIMRESGALEALARLKKKGMIRAIGISTKTAEGAMLAVTGTASSPAPSGGGGAAVAPIDVLMLTLNAHDQSNLPAIQSRDREGAAPHVGILIKKAFASGYFAPPPPPVAAATGARVIPGATAEGARAHDPIEASLRLCLVEPAVSSVIVGTINPSHLEQNVRAAERVLG